MADSYHRVGEADFTLLPNPPAGTHYFGFDTSTGKFSTKDSAGVVEAMATASQLVADYAQMRQDSAIWAGNGQPLRSGANWVYFDAEDVDTNNFHDATAQETGTATGTHSTTTLQDTGQAWTVNEWTGFYCRITGGTNIDDVVKILSNTADTITVDSTWQTTVDNTSAYEFSLAGRLTTLEAGVYQISPRLTYQNSTTGLRGLFIYKNGAFFNSVFLEPVDNVESAAWLNPQLIAMGVGDYVEIQSYQTAAPGHELLAFGARNTCSIIKIGD